MDAIDHYKRRRKIAIIALGGECIVCGTNQNLEIDHIDPQAKTINLSRDWYNKRWWIEVLTQCQLLCKFHHQQKSSSEASKRNRKDRSLLHGTLSQYTRYKCRCDPCRENHKAYKAKLRAKHKSA